jgi:tyrosyl-tRNA synthetase
MVKETNMPNFFAELKWRELLHTHTPGVEEHLAQGRVTAYIGFDPTAPSLHVGSLLPIMGLVHLQRAGHTPIAVAGGGTGMIGDPSGKAQERKLLTREEIDAYLVGIKKQLSHFLDFNTSTNPAHLVNNADWLGKLSMMEFLRDVGKYFSVNEMLAKESVKSRLDKEQGISFTEFSYSLLQAYDYLQLHRRYGCTLQMGGSDQWGNIVAGIDLIRRLCGAEAHAIVFPLITSLSGVKFGKTELGTVWLDPARTSPYRFYQFWFNTEDRDVGRYLRFFTLLPEEKILELEESIRLQPERREAQTTLALETTRMLHGDTETQKAVRASRIFFGGEISEVTDLELLDIFSDVPSTEISRVRLEGNGMPLVDLLVSSGVARSKGEARRAIQGGGIYLNNRRAADVERSVLAEEAIYGKFFVLRKGSRHYVLVKLL